ncbi:MAG: hypothetical protein FWD97_01850 [Defluviitaleaceae bacterium]|nr:hypothetical protein [Defluviitaleaceae bacterium]
MILLGPPLFTFEEAIYIIVLMYVIIPGGIIGLIFLLRFFLKLKAPEISKAHLIVLSLMIAIGIVVLVLNYLSSTAFFNRDDWRGGWLDFRGYAVFVLASATVWLILATKIKIIRRFGLYSSFIVSITTLSVLLASNIGTHGWIVDDISISERTRVTSDLQYVYRTVVINNRQLNTSIILETRNLTTGEVIPVFLERDFFGETDSILMARNTLFGNFILLEVSDSPGVYTAKLMYHFFPISNLRHSGGIQEMGTFVFEVDLIEGIARNLVRYFELDIFEN